MLFLENVLGSALISTIYAIICYWIMVRTEGALGDKSSKAIISMNVWMFISANILMVGTLIGIIMVLFGVNFESILSVMVWLFLSTIFGLAISSRWIITLVESLGYSMSEFLGNGKEDDPSNYKYNTPLIKQLSGDKAEDDIYRVVMKYTIDSIVDLVNDNVEDIVSGEIDKDYVVSQALERVKGVGIIKESGRTEDEIDSMVYSSVDSIFNNEHTLNVFKVLNTYIGDSTPEVSREVDSKKENRYDTIVYKGEEIKEEINKKEKEIGCVLDRMADKVLDSDEDVYINMEYMQEKMAYLSNLRDQLHQLHQLRVKAHEQGESHEYTKEYTVKEDDRQTSIIDESYKEDTVKEVEDNKQK